ncbi:MAG TPA: hypothetical protein VNC11_16880 [Gemmatimonadaceae bacterium]|jgi:hypothetical protein|nr:hypothetical protein [Gemmatimonadaceae bacterium]
MGDGAISMLALIALIVPYVLIALSWLAIPLVLFFFGRRLIRAVEGRTLIHSDLAAIADRLYRLEVRVEQVATDTEKISEGQYFASALLAGHGTGTRR